MASSLQAGPAARKRPLPEPRQPHPFGFDRRRADSCCRPPDRKMASALHAAWLARRADSRFRHGSARRGIAQRGRDRRMFRSTSSIGMGKGEVNGPQIPSAVRSCAVARPPPPMVSSRVGRVASALSNRPAIAGKAPPDPPQADFGRIVRQPADAGDLRRPREQQQIFVGAQVERRDRSAALAAKSEAKPGIDAPSFGAVADDVLIIVVKRIGDAHEDLDLGSATHRRPARWPANRGRASPG